MGVALRAELIDGGGTRRKKEGRKAQDMTRRQERGDDGDEGRRREAQERKETWRRPMDELASARASPLTPRPALVVMD